MKIVDKNIDEPLHIQLSQIIKDMIINKELVEGTYLIPERELCKLQNISRMTVNKAILNLVNEGLLERKQGKGTFVAYKKQKYQYQNLKGFTEVMNEKGFNVKNKILNFEIKTQSENIREILNIEDKNELIFKIERLRIIEDKPFALETVYIPQKMCFDLNEKLVEENSLYTLFKQRYNYKTKKAVQTIEPIMLNKYDADTLKQEVNSLALKFYRLVYTQDDEILEYTISRFTSDKYQYQIVLTD
ncbi:GntR family transcriptional regulator [Romboutsia sp.]|uniref:GntR family transcriptional regulator n=1 Tax=Romboutsia sp. TaxID=1965302 RepID=UPI002C0DBD58|nr:GntR family transcriptional regulator [Romboutsia sp.]HSQ87351.1 GntR family transcriptional regulator [Romboutsia sp.]